MASPLLIETTLEGRHWADVLENLVDKEEYLALLNCRSSKLLSIHSLIECVGKGKARTYEKLANEAGVFAEIGRDGARRCVYVKEGKRCKAYVKGIMCVEHYEEVSMFTRFFQSQEFRQRFEAFKNSPQRMQLNDEQALMRVLITELVSKMGKPGDVPIELIGGLTTMIDKLSVMTDKMAKMNEITPEAVENLLDKVVDILVKFVPQEKLEEASKEVSKLKITKIESTLAYDPGANIEYAGEEVKIKVKQSDNEAIKNRAFVDIAKRLGVTQDELEDMKAAQVENVK
jgi:hypothetical protein